MDISGKCHSPISNTIFLLKVLEKDAFSQFFSHVHKNGLCNINQSGYKQNHSCETALLCIINSIQQSIHNDNLTEVLKLDLSVAFDTIDYCFPTFFIWRHTIQLFKLSRHSHYLLIIKRSSLRICH